MMSIMLGIIATFVVAVAGWLVTNFVAKPYLNFWNLRSQVHEEIVFTANVAPIDVGSPRYLEVADSLRRLGAKVLTTNNTAFPPLRLYLSKAGFDLAKAGDGLIALSKSLADSGPHHRAIYTNRIQVGLKLQRDYTDDDLCQMKKEISQGHQK
jgi:hypothetical protein